MFGPVTILATDMETSGIFFDLNFFGRDLLRWNFISLAIASKFSEEHCCTFFADLDKKTLLKLAFYRGDPGALRTSCSNFYSKSTAETNIFRCYFNFNFDFNCFQIL